MTSRGGGRPVITTTVVSLLSRGGLLCLIFFFFFFSFLDEEKVCGETPRVTLGVYWINIYGRGEGLHGVISLITDSRGAILRLDNGSFSPGYNLGEACFPGTPLPPLQ